MVLQILYEGKLTSLRRVKDDVKEVSKGLECGLRVDGFASWREGDHITAFQASCDPDLACLQLMTFRPVKVMVHASSSATFVD